MHRLAKMRSQTAIGMAFPMQCPSVDAEAPDIMRHSCQTRGSMPAQPDFLVSYTSAVLQTTATIEKLSWANDKRSQEALHRGHFFKIRESIEARHEIVQVGATGRRDGRKVATLHVVSVGPHVHNDDIRLALQVPAASLARFSRLGCDGLKSCGL